MSTKYTDDQRIKAYTLSLIAGTSKKDIAKKLGVPTGSVSRLISQGSKLVSAHNSGPKTRKSSKSAELPLRVAISVDLESQPYEVAVHWLPDSEKDVENSTYLVMSLSVITAILTIAELLEEILPDTSSITISAALFDISDLESVTQLISPQDIPRN